MTNHYTKVQLYTFAEAKLHEYGLLQQGWTFKFSNKARIFGQCYYDRKTIYLSWRLVQSCNDKNKPLNTILHEIAHALAGAGTGHGYLWARQCKVVGIEPVKCYNGDLIDNETMDHKYKWECPKCKNVGYFNHLGNSWKTGKKICSVCKVKLNVYENGKLLDFDKQISKYTLNCPVCDYTSSKGRKLKYDRSCGRCSPNKWNTKYKLIVTQNY